MSKKKAYIITGTSRGLGEAIARQLIDPDHLLFCVSRSGNDALRQQAKAAGCAMQDDRCDLTDILASEAWIRGVLDSLDPEEINELVVVQNAGLLNPIKLIGRKSPVEEVEASVQVNLLSPMRTTEVLVEMTQKWPIAKKVVMISSGAASHPIASWSTYCTTKAGLEMFARCLDEEQNKQEHPIMVLSIAPGVVETLMQKHIRKQPKEIFPGVDRFISLHADKLLSTPEEAADKIISRINRPDFGAEVVVDVRDS